MCIRSILSISIDSGCFLASYWLCMGLFHRWIFHVSLIATNIQPLEPHLAGQGIFFFSCIAALEAFFRTVCSRWPSLPTDYLLFEVRGMSSQRVSIFVACLCDVQTNPIPICFFSTLICQGTVAIPYNMYIRQLCHYHTSIQLCQAFWNFPRFYGGRISTTASTQPSSTLSQWCPMCRGIGLGLRLPWRVQWNGEMQRWIRFFMVFLYLSLHWIITFHSINRYECCNEP